MFVPGRHTLGRIADAVLPPASRHPCLSNHDILSPSLSCSSFPLPPGEDASAEVGKLRALQEQLGTPYLPLDGKALLPGKGGDDDDAALPVTRQPRGGGHKPQLGGGLTPLLGDKKVEAMYGIKKPEGASRHGGGGGSKGHMPPPKPKGK